MDWNKEVSEDEIRWLEEQKADIPQVWRPSQKTIQAIQDGKPEQEFQTDGRESELTEEKIHYHHIYPKFRGNEEYSSFFEELGINVDQWTVAVDAETHLKYIHSEVAWNEAWKAWIDEHRGETTTEETLKFGRQLLTQFGLEGLWEGDAYPDPSYYVPDDEIRSRPPRSRK